MGLLDAFRKKDKTAEPEIDPLKDLVLAKLRVGYLVDYDLKTWQVTAYNRYRFNDGATTEEWELTAGREKRYLELSQDDGDVWCLARKVPIGALEGNVRNHIIEHDDPPDQVIHQGTTYYLDSSVGGKMFAGGGGAGQELIKWEFIDEDDENFLTVEQWGETEFEASAGTYVEDYQFTNILPGKLE